MLKLRKGCKVPHNEKLSEGYMRNGNVIVVYGAEHECFTGFFEKYDIPEMFKD